jgi:hypothetical protein
MTTPQYRGLTPSVGGFRYAPTSQGTITIYNQIVIPSDFWVLNHQGYIYASQTGVYTFTSYVSLLPACQNPIH